MGMVLTDTRSRVYLHRGARYQLLHEIAEIDENVGFLHRVSAQDIPYDVLDIVKVKKVNYRELFEPITLDEFCNQLTPADPVIIAMGQDNDIGEGPRYNIEVIAEAGSLHRDNYRFNLAIPQTDQNLRQILDVVRDHYGPKSGDWREVVN